MTRTCVLLPTTIVAPFEARETVVPETVISPPGVTVCIPTTNPDAEFAVMVELPIVTIAGVVATATGDVDGEGFAGSTTTGVVDGDGFAGSTIGAVDVVPVGGSEFATGAVEVA